MEENEYKCKICNKFYKNYKSLWKHNYTYHNKSCNPKSNPNVIQSHPTVIQNQPNKYKCNNCDKTFKNKISNYNIY